MSSFSIGRSAAANRSRLGWLPVSIAVNLLLIGLVLAWVWNMPPPERQPLVSWQREIIPSLSPGDAAIVTEATGRISDSQVTCDEAVHSQYAKIRALVAAEPVDGAAIRAGFDQIIALRNTQQTTALHAFSDELNAISPDGRQKILAGMKREAARARPVPGR